MDRILMPVLQRAGQLVAAAGTYAFALADLPGIELPPASSAAVDQAQLRALAVLYLAAELENAGLIPATESLARLAMSGSLPGDLGDAAGLIQAFWRGRNARPSIEERTGFFATLFGAGSGPGDSRRGRNEQFEDLLIDLCEALYKLDEQGSSVSWGSPAQQARVRTTARRVLDNLVRVSGGITVFMAQEVLAAIREAIAILGHPAVMTSLRARTVWDSIDAIDRMLRAPLHEHALFVRRGQSGMTILAWLADAAPALDGISKPLVSLDHPVIPAAVDWLEASLGLGQAAQAPPSASRDSGWAGLAG